METDATRSLENAQLISLQRDAISRQDDSLKDVSKTVNVIHNLAQEIGGELDLHRGLLDDIDGRADRVSDKMAREQGRMTRLTKKQQGCCVFVLIFFLIGIIVTLALTKWGCTIIHSKSRCNN
jgi:syntaxin 8